MLRVVTSRACLSSFIGCNARLGSRMCANKSSNDDIHDDFKPKHMPPTSTGSVEDLIKKDITENDVFLYMKGFPNQPMCGFSSQVVQILKSENISFASRNVLDNPEIREGIKKFSDWPTIPQLYIHGDFVGGCDIVTQLYRERELKSLLEQNKE